MKVATPLMPQPMNGTLFSNVSKNTYYVCCEASNGDHFVINIARAVVLHVTARQHILGANTLWVFIFHPVCIVYRLSVKIVSMYRPTVSKMKDMHKQRDCLKCFE